MLDLRFKNLHLMSSFIGLEQSKAIIEEYDRKDLECHVFKMYYHHLHPWTENVIVDQGFDENYSLGIFEILAKFK